VEKCAAEDSGSWPIGFRSTDNGEIRFRRTREDFLVMKMAACPDFRKKLRDPEIVKDW